MNPLRQAQRFDKAGQYVARYVPELAGLDRAQIQTPWQLGRKLDYPGPIVELS
jgi:deoxyribodipyrimidine photo-lyase